MKFNIITLFPHLIESLKDSGVVGQALQKQIAQINIVNPRSFTEDVHKTVDDRPFGGGDGMVLLAEPFKKSVESLPERGRVVALTAMGSVWNHKKAKEWAKAGETVTLVCGRYAGFDQRFIEKYVDEEISIGDFILSGGEWPACMIIDSVCRYLPGVLGNSDSALKESFENGGLEGPQFTRPREWEGLKVPEILMGGNHELINKFRAQVSLLWTLRERPDLVTEINPKKILEAQAQIEKLEASEREALGLTDLSFLGRHN